MIYSMTAYANSTEQGNFGHIIIEFKSVNHRYLDINFKLPESLKSLELEIRELLRDKIRRGHIDCFLQYKPTIGTAVKLDINKQLLAEIIRALDEINLALPSAKNVNPLQLLNWPEMIQIKEENKDELHAAIIGLCKKTLTDLVANRAREGEKLKAFLLEKLQSIPELTAKIKAKMPEILNNYRMKLAHRLSEIRAELDPQRVEQEIVIFAQKIDIMEELERISAHVKEMSRLLQQGGYIGKNIDFMLQELNREANTMAAKSADLETTNAAVAIKILVEQMREQAQNIA